MSPTQNRRKPPGARASRWRRVALAALAGIAALFLATGVQAQNPPAPARKPVPSNRFLFVVDTSSAMKKYAEPTLLAVRAILAANANGQMRSGDTLGIWTFNSDLFTGRFPLQIWDAEDSDSLAMQAVEFLGRQPFQKRSHLDKALARLNEVIHSSDLITVFIISTGEGKMVGTPFDQTINRFYEQDLKEMGKSRMPLVTVLEARGGQVFDFTVNVLPWPVVIHPLPIPPEPPKPVEPPPAAVALTPTPEPGPPDGFVEMPKGSPPVQPLIIRGSPPKPAESNLVSSPAPLQPMTTTPLTTNLPSTSPAVGLEAAAPPLFAGVKTDAVISTPPPVVKSAPAPAPTPPPPTVVATVPPPAATVAPPPAVTAPPPVRPAPDASPRKTNPPSVQALAVVSPPAARPNELLILGLAFLVLGVGLILLLVRRSRATSGPSLITTSMGNPRK